jgi:hypothetical protein
VRYVFDRGLAGGPEQTPTRPIQSRLVRSPRSHNGNLQSGQGDGVGAISADDTGARLILFALPVHTSCTLRQLTT